MTYLRCHYYDGISGVFYFKEKDYMRIYLMLIVFICTLNGSAQDRWEKLNGPKGAVITGLFAKGDTVFAGTGFYKGLIFYSTNRGYTWSKADFKTSYLELGDQSRINRFIFSDDGGVIVAAGRNGLYKSFNLTNWSRILRNNEDYWGLGKDISGALYASGVHGTIFRSSNNGTIWNAMNSGTTDPIVTFLLAKDSSMLAGSYMKVLKKKFNSDVWELIEFQDQNNLDLFTDTTNNVYAYNNGYLYLSTDNGLKWDMLDTNHFFYGTYVYSMIFNNRIIGSCGTNIFQPGWGIILSDDKGVTWKYSNTGLPVKITAVKLAKSGNDTYVGTNAAGVFKSTDFGESWFAVNNGITSADTWDITFDNDGSIYAACWSNGIQKSTDKGNTWEVINNGLTNVYLYSIISDDNNNLIAGTDQGIFRSTDKGLLWVQTNPAGNNFAYRLYKDKFNRIYSMNYGDGIYRTTDLGVTWYKIDNGFASRYVFGIAMDSNNNLYAGTWGGNIYKSTNDGANWLLLRSSSIYNCVIDRIMITPKGDIFATNTDEGVLRSTDNGLTWTIQNQGLTGTGVTALGISSKGELYVSTKDDKLFNSTNNGDTWSNAVSNLKMIKVQDISFDKEDNVYLATDESVWRSNPDSTVYVNDKSPTVTNYSLSQNYPNPFNPVTTIKYSISNNGLVKLQIFDILGREVKTLVNEEKPTGEYEVQFNGSSLASGVYIYKLTAGTFTQVRKMQILK